jgi:hypothetical protein
VECLIAGAGCVVAALALAFWAGGRTRRDPWELALRQVAARFHGAYQPGGWFQSSCVWLRHGEAHSRLFVLALGLERCLQLSLEQPAVQVRCAIFHQQTRPALVPIARGMEPLEFDGEQFFNRWYVLTSAGDEVRHLLTDGVRGALDHLWLDPFPAETSISLAPGLLVVRKLWKHPDAVDLERFIELAGALADELQRAAASTMLSEPQEPSASGDRAWENGPASSPRPLKPR